MLESEANYAASALMFCGPAFIREALDTSPEWDKLARRPKSEGAGESTKGFHLVPRPPEPLLHSRGFETSDRYG